MTVSFPDHMSLLTSFLDRGQIVNDIEARLLNVQGKASQRRNCADVERAADALITDVPEPVIDILRLTCPERVVVASE